jgi:hypothetical protein
MLVMSMYLCTMLLVGALQFSSTVTSITAEQLVPDAVWLTLVSSFCVNTHDYASYTPSAEPRTSQRTDSKKVVSS